MSLSIGAATKLTHLPAAGSKPAAKMPLANISQANGMAVANPDTSSSAKLTNPKTAALATNVVSLPKKSGNANVDAVLAGGNNWWHIANATASLSTTKITPDVLQIDPAQSRHKLTYAFLAGTESYVTKEDQTGFAALDDGQKTAVKSAFDYLASLINVSFSQASDIESADIVFGSNAQPSSAGYADYPNAVSGGRAKLMLANNGDSAKNNAASNLSTQGTYGWETLIHEIGHTMGLKHPGNYNAGGGGTPGPYLSASLDQRAVSIMSYHNPPASKLISVKSVSTAHGIGASTTLINANPKTYGVYDIAALQYLYGANLTTSSPASLSLSNSYFDYQTLWAPKGVKIDASATSQANIFDLREGGFSSVAMKFKADYSKAISDSLVSQNFKLANASGTADAILKTSSLMSSLYNGKNNLALSFGSRFSQIDGGAGSDSFYASTYSASIDGKGGSNQLYLMGTAKDWAIDKTKGTATNAQTKAVIAYKNIQKLAFYAASTSLMHA